ncbi:MAG: hypothetical protein WKF43_13400 [Acidimicrobiales bacterium]
MAALPRAPANYDTGWGPVVRGGIDASDDFGVEALGHMAEENMYRRADDTMASDAVSEPSDCAERHGVATPQGQLGASATPHR